MENLYTVPVETKGGEFKDLSEYKGKTLLIVNTASKCGFTPQLTGLQSLYEEYTEKGLVVLGFPCNQFLKQDPKSIGEIVEFCQLNYGVSFPIYGKLNVKGKEQSKLYDYLVNNSPVRKGKKVKWNFEKFLINKDGEIVNRFSPKVTPESIKSDIEAIL